MREGLDIAEAVSPDLSVPILTAGDLNEVVKRVSGIPTCLHSKECNADTVFSQKF